MVGFHGVLTPSDETRSWWMWKGRETQLVSKGTWFGAPAAERKGGGE